VSRSSSDLLGPNVAVAPLEKGCEKRTFYLIQVLRAIAALMIVVVHCVVQLKDRFNIKDALPYGWASGVDIFFVISGFVMTVSSQSLIAAPRGMSVFLKRRIERIVPLYWMATTLKIVLVILSPGIAINTIGSRWHIISSYLFLPTFNRGVPNPVLSVGWTLNYEMLFYLLFAIALGMGWPLLRVLVPALSAISAAAFIAHGKGLILLNSYDPMVLEFLGGVLLARATLARKIPSVFVSVGLIIVGFTTLLMNHHGDDSLYRVFVWGIPALAIVAGAVGLEGRLGRRIPGWLLEIGDASFAIYICHGFVLPPVGVLVQRLRVSDRLEISLLVILGVMVAMGCGVVLNLVVERPIMRYLRGRRSLPANV
jgi:exopolysaccharide production protein ExoZ